MLLKRDPVTRSRTDFYYDHTDDTVVIEERTDVQPTIEKADAMRRHFTSAKDPHGEWGSLVAMIPPSIFYKIPAHIREDDKALLRWCQDPDNRVWKIHPGRFV